MSSTVATLKSPRMECWSTIERRFGWLKRRLAAVRGNLSALAPNEQALWRARERVVGEYNRIGELRDPFAKRRRYQKLTKECDRSGGT